MMPDSWQVTLFHHHPDGSITQYAWWVNAQYATEMLASMGEPDAKALMDIQDVLAEVAAARQRHADEELTAKYLDAAKRVDAAEREVALLREHLQQIEDAVRTKPEPSPW